MSLSSTKAQQGKSDIRQADRGMKLAFGGKLPISKPTTPSPVGNNFNTKQPKKLGKADQWLASWQPKPKSELPAQVDTFT